MTKKGILTVTVGKLQIIIKVNEIIIILLLILININ
jgi:hypothetical protein